jgi:dTDP-4-dehydrorhamnose reductase
MRVVVLGGTGQVGLALVPLLRHEHEVVAPARDELDLAQPGAQAHVERLAPALVVNAAAWTDVDAAERDEPGCLAVNAAGAGAVARACARLGAPLVHLSTDFVFSGELGRPYREDDATGPVNAYGRAKLAGEREVERAGAIAFILRTSWVYSLGRPSFVSRMIERARKAEELVAADDQVGSPTSADALAEVIAALVRSLRRGPRARAERSAGLYHLAGRGATSRYELTCAIVEALGARPGIRATRVRAAPATSFVTDAARPRATALDCSRAERALGLALRPWRSALEQMLASARSVGEPGEA